MKNRTTIILLSTLLITLMFGCAKKKDTLEDQFKTPEPEVKQEIPEAEPPKPDPSVIREQEFQQEAREAFRTIYFAYDSYSLNEEARNILARIGDFSRKYNEVRVVVEGHCDERGSSEYNMALGQKRADEAKKYLTSYGISASRVSTVSWGEEKPAVAGMDEDSYSKNRRAELLYER